ncbi:hypothetical protein VPH35_057920 [Triticum aestivum]|uniref:uncharacterized protein n=1 Tax=Triticum aestivum TaxID=4565 RepID=UPI001D02590C|nr:uncharacterized protein LOC123077114 [Triticum aestivum]
MKLHLAFSVMEKCRLQRRIQPTPRAPSLPSLRPGCVSIDFHAISFAVAIMVGFMLKRSLCQWAVRTLKRVKDDTKKGFPPLCMTKQPSDTTNDRRWGGSSTNTPKRNEREKRKETNADNVESTKTTKPRDRCVHRRSPTKLRDSEAPVPINSSKKGCDNDDAAAKGFPQYAARREEG